MKSQTADKKTTSPVQLFAAAEATFTPKVQLWLADAQDCGFGHGRMQLFWLIDELGSLSKAAQALGMSYRAAWGKIREMEQATGTALVHSQGSKREGYSLTPEGRALMLAFSQWFDDVQAYAVARAQACFPVKIESREHTS